MKIYFTALMLVLFSFNATADNASIFKVTVNKPLNIVYKSMETSFDDSSFGIVKELNIGENLEFFAKKWGDKYNQNNLTAFRSMVFCSGWYANKISNEDPNMLAFCPMHITFIEKDAKTTVSFVKPTFIAKNSPAYDTFVEIENAVISVIKNGIK